MTKEERLIAIKARLQATAVRRWPDDPERQNRYVWGTINKLKERMKRA